MTKKFLLTTSQDNGLKKALMHHHMRTSSPEDFTVNTLDEIDFIFDGDDTVEVKIDSTLTSDRQNAIITLLRKRHQEKNAKTIILRSTAVTSPKADTLLFYHKNTFASNSNYSIEFENTAAVVGKEYFQKNILVITNIFPLHVNKNWTYYITSDAPASSIRHVPTENLKRIIIEGRDNHRLIADISKFILSSELIEISTIQNNRIVPLRYENNIQAKGLFIFPDRMLPVKRAFQMRGLDMIAHLNKMQLYTDALVLGPNNRDLDKINNILSAFAPKVYTFPMQRGLTRGVHKVFRRLESYFRRALLRIEQSPPMTFKQRIHTFVSPEHIAYLESVLEQNKYEYIIVTGAWFFPALEKVAEKYHAKLLCDTHDIFFISDAGSNHNEKRFFYFPEAEKKLELELLNKFDRVIAISDSDLENLLKHGNENGFTATGSFEYALLPIQEKIHNNFRYGFIGTSNNNNQKALQKIIDEWFAILLKHDAQVSVLLAGSICKTDLAESFRKKYPQNVQLLGFVDDLSEYYNSIDISLSPIMLQGGLNFKTVEALMAGKPVLTTEIGQRCVAGSKGIYTITDDDSLTNTLQNFQGIDDWSNYTIDIQNNALERFGEKNGFSSLDDYLFQFFSGKQ